MLDVIRRFGALATTLVILALGAQACMSTLKQPSADLNSPTAAVMVAVAAPSPAAPSPVAPSATPLPPTPDPPTGPTYGMLDLQTAAGWTPEARDLSVGPQLYRPLDERQGDSCRIRVITGQAADGQVQTADVWIDCDAMEMEL